MRKILISILISGLLIIFSTTLLLANNNTILDFDGLEMELPNENDTLNMDIYEDCEEYGESNLDGLCDDTTNDTAISLNIN